MKILQKKSVAILLTVVMVLAGVGIGQVRANQAPPVPTAGETALDTTLSTAAYENWLWDEADVFSKSEEKQICIYNANWDKYNHSEMFEVLSNILNERDTVYKNYVRFYDLIDRYPAEPEHEYSLTETGEYDLRNKGIIDEFYDNVKYTDEEIVFMAEYDFDTFSNKFPGICEYYMQCLDYRDVLGS